MKQDENEKIVKFLGELSDTELWYLFGKVKVLLMARGLVRTNNIIGERGEFAVVDIYNNTPGLPNLQKAPEGTQNVDALSRKGDRYSIKTITFPGKTTGVFYGIEQTDLNLEKKFEYVVIVLLDNEMTPIHIYELDWDTFLKFKRWHSRMRAFNLSITSALIESSRVIL